MLEADCSSSTRRTGETALGGRCTAHLAQRFWWALHAHPWFAGRPVQCDRQRLRAKPISEGRSYVPSCRLAELIERTLLLASWRFASAVRARRGTRAAAVPLAGLLVSGFLVVLTPGAAFAGTPPAHTIASAAPLRIGQTQSGGGAHIDFWRVTLGGGDQVQLSVTEPYATYVFQLFSAGTTDDSFAQAVAVAGTTTNGNSPDVTSFQAPYSGTFILAVCENVANNNCPTVDSSSGTNPMGHYSFKPTLIGGGVPPAVAARETRASGTIAAARPLTVGDFEAGGGAHIDFCAREPGRW